MATSAEETRHFTHDYSTAFDATVAAIRSTGMSVTSADPTAGMITASASLSMASWGEDLNFRLWQEHDGRTAVQITSALKFGFVDWGRNQKNVDKVFEALDAHLANPGLDTTISGAPGHPQPQPTAPAAGWHADPMGRHEHRYWDGTQWTDQVSDAGQVSSDPVS